MKKCYFITFCVTAFIFTLLAVSKQVAQQKSQYPKQEHQMTYQPGSQPKDQIIVKSSSNVHQIVHLSAEEFRFETRVNFPSSVQTKPDQYTESITHDQDGSLDIILITQGNTTKYILQVSSIPKNQCHLDHTRACQQGAAAPARGNIAEISITLDAHKLKPGTYILRGGSTPTEEVITYSRQLYSDPSHGKLGCQVWGEGTFKVKKAVYNVNGNLEYLDASLVRVCDQTAPFPPTRPEDNLLQVNSENIEKYTYHATWFCRLKVMGASSSL